MSNQVFCIPISFHFFSIFILLQIFPGPDLQAQNHSATVSGIVRNTSGNAAIPFASVTFKKTLDSGFVAGVITDEESRFQVSNIKPGEYRVSISSSG